MFDWRTHRKTIERLEFAWVRLSSIDWSFGFVRLSTSGLEGGREDEEAARRREYGKTVLLNHNENATWLDNLTGKSLFVKISGLFFYATDAVSRPLWFLSVSINICKTIYSHVVVEIDEVSLSPNVLEGSCVGKEMFPLHRKECT